MSGKCRPSLREKTLENVKWCNLSQTDKDCIKAVFELAEQQQAEIERLQTEKDNLIKTYKECATEVIKDFLYRLKSIPNIVVYKREIDAIAEEMGVKTDAD